MNVLLPLIVQSAPALANLALKSVLLLLLTCLAVRMTRRASAATRHWIWLAGLISCLLLPFTVRVRPALDLAMLPAAMPAVNAVQTSAFDTNPDTRSFLRSDRERSFSASARAAESSDRDHLRGGSEATIRAQPQSSTKLTVKATLASTIVIVWLVGLFAVSAYWLAGWIAVRRSLRSATSIVSTVLQNLARSAQSDLGIAGEVALRLGPTTAMPLVFGTRRPIILLPRSAESWPADQLRSVLLHELAHVQRNDCLAIRLTQVAAALYWWNPLIWLAAARLRGEQERACDDLVIHQNVAPADYARDLLTIAQRLRSPRLASSGALAMARPSGLRLRVARILDRNINRASASRRWVFAALLLGVLTLLAVSVVRLSTHRATTVAAQPTTSPATTLPATTAPALAEWMSPAKVNATGAPFTLTVLEAETNQPLANAKVDYFNDLSADVPYRGYTDAAGRLVIKMPTEPSLVVQALDHVWRWIDFDRANGVKLPADYTVHLEKGTTIGGRIVDDAGQAIPGAKVILGGQFKAAAEKNERRYITRQPVVADRNGHWQMHEAPAENAKFRIGVFDLNHLENDYTPMQDYSDVTSLRDQSATWILPRGTAISGTIYGADDKPIPKADIAFGADQVPSNAIPYWHSDDNGHYAMAVKAGKTAVITASPHGYAPDLRTIVVGKDPMVVDFHLNAASTISGTVVDSTGKPVPHAFIDFDSWRGYRSNPHPDHTDAQGHFAWHNAPADTVLVTVGGHDLTYRTGVPMTAGEPVTVTLDPLLKINVTALDAQSGAPIPAFRCILGERYSEQDKIFWLRGQDDAAGVNGKCTLSPNYPYREYAVLVEADGYAPMASRLFKDAERDVTLEFKLTQAPELSTLIRNPDGTAAADATAVLIGGAEFLNVDDTNIGSMENEKMRLLADGRAHFPPTTEPFMVAVVGDKGYAEIPGDQFRSGKPITLQNWATISGTLRLGSAKGAGLKVNVRRIEPDLQSAGPHVAYDLTATTDAQGHFHFDRVPPRRIMISRLIERGSGQDFTGSYAQSQTVDLEAGQSLDVQLGGKGRAVVGQVQIPSELTARSDWTWNFDTQIRQQPTNAELPAPDEIKHAPPDKQRAWYQEFLLTDAGKKYRADLNASNARQLSYPLEIEPDGRFRIEDVAAGKYQLHVTIARRLQVGGASPYPLAEGKAEFIIPAMPDDRSDEPLVLPIVTMQMTPANPATTQSSTQP